MKKSLADELGDIFEDVDLSPIDVPEGTESAKCSFEEVSKIRSVDENYPEEPRPTACSRKSSSPLPTDAFPGCSVAEDEPSPAADTPGNETVSRSFRKTKFVEHLSACETAPQPRTSKEYIRFMALTNNRELIDRTASGFFKMETRPMSTEVERRQSQGIAALQKTLAHGNLSNAAIPSTGSSHGKALDAGKRPSSLRQVSFAEPQNRRSNQDHASDTAPKRKVASRVSLGRALIVAAHQKKIPEPLAPTRFVKLSTDPAVSFKRNFAEFGLKVETKPDWDMIEAGESRSTLSPPEFYSTEGFIFEKRKPRIDKPECAFGVAGAEIVNQCLEPSCPLRWAHTKGPYHHKGDHNNKIMTGLFGHSNPPPEIWHAYRKMVKLTSAGAMMSPDGSPRSHADEGPVIAFAKFHFGELNGISGDEFHRRFAGKHMSSRISLGCSSTSTSSS
ncbi:hypothetical protein BDR22DRAFT_823662 [Usnea florida]